MIEPLFLTIAETAGLLGISDDTVYELAATGELPCTTFRSRKMVPRRAIDMILERTLEGFDPDALVLRLAAAADSSAEVGSTGSSGPTGMVPSARHHRDSVGTGAPATAVR